jgi:hypothetical protein
MAVLSASLPGRATPTLLVHSSLPAAEGNAANVSPEGGDGSMGLREFPAALSPTLSSTLRDGTENELFQMWSLGPSKVGAALPSIVALAGSKEE